MKSEAGFGKGVIYVITRGIEQYCNIVSNDYVLIG